MSSKLSDLNKEFVAAVVLYRLVECDEEISVDVKASDFSEFSAELSYLVSLEAIRENKKTSCYEATEKGISLLDKMFDTYESLLDLDIFSGVNLLLEVPDDLFNEEGHVMDGELDPRFEEPVDEAEAEVFGTTDLRLPILDYLINSCLGGSGLSYTPELRIEALCRTIFLLELGSDRFNDEEAFFDLKIEDITTEFNGIVSSISPWIELAREYSPPERLMEMIIKAGFLDAKKRDLLEDEAYVWLDKEKRCELSTRLLRPLC